MKESWAAFEKRITREQLSLLKTVNYQESLGFSCVIAERSGGMITILSALVSVLSFRFRSRASLELELVALRHQLIVWRWQSRCPGRPRASAEIRALIRQMSRANPFWDAASTATCSSSASR